ncbi:hypothetical protein UlMin_025321 [Ulmus minor]
MSTSTVSLTANPATRRRPVVATEKKSNIELVAAEPQSKAADDKSTAANGRDLSNHSIRGEAVLERSSRDAVQIKKNGAISTVSPPSSRRSRKPLPPKPRWVTVLRIFAKNFVLLIVLVGLVQMIRRLALRSGENSPLAFTDFEGRIGEIEKLVKTTTKMMQVQVEAVDRKIDNEVGGLRKEVTKKIEDKGVVLEGQLKELEAKSDDLERSLGELRDGKWLSKEEFDRIFGDGEVSLDGVRAYAKDVVMKELEKHAADGLGMVDYALASGGGMVLKHSDPWSAGKGSNWFLTSKKGVDGHAVRMLKPSFGEPGQCFPLRGSSGFVQIKLRTAIIPEAITLEHVAKSVSYDRTSAPKDCRVSGWLQAPNMEVASDSSKRFLLSEFTYDLEKSNAQTSKVLDSAGSNLVDTVRFDFTSNHGNPSHTCIYRLRVHGHEPDKVSVMPMQS